MLLLFVLKSDSLLESLEGCFGNQCLNREGFFIERRTQGSKGGERGRERGKENERERERERERESK